MSGEPANQLQRGAEHVVSNVTEGEGGWISLRDAERAGAGSYNTLRAYCKAGMRHALVNGPRGRPKPLVKIDDVERWRAAQGKVKRPDARRGRRKTQRPAETAPASTAAAPVSAAWQGARDRADERDADRLATEELQRDAEAVLAECSAAQAGAGKIDRAKLRDVLWTLATRFSAQLETGSAAMEIPERKVLADTIKQLADQARAIEKRLDEEHERDGKTIDRAHAGRLLGDLAAQLRSSVESMAVDLPDRIVAAVTGASALRENADRDAVGRVISAAIRDHVAQAMDALADQVGRQAEAIEP